MSFESKTPLDLVDTDAKPSPDDFPVEDLGHRAFAFDIEANGFSPLIGDEITVASFYEVTGKEGLVIINTGPSNEDDIPTEAVRDRVLTAIHSDEPDREVEVELVEGDGALLEACRAFTESDRFGDARLITWDEPNYFSYKTFNFVRTRTLKNRVEWPFKDLLVTNASTVYRSYVDVAYPSVDNFGFEELVEFAEYVDVSLPSEADDDRDVVLDRLSEADVDWRSVYDFTEREEWRSAHSSLSYLSEIHDAFFPRDTLAEEYELESVFDQLDAYEDGEWVRVGVGAFTDARMIARLYSVLPSLGLYTAEEGRVSRLTIHTNRL